MIVIAIVLLISTEVYLSPFERTSPREIWELEELEEVVDVAAIALYLIWVGCL